jgi:hypothetical protein
VIRARHLLDEGHEQVAARDVICLVARNSSVVASIIF